MKKKMNKKGKMVFVLGLVVGLILGACGNATGGSTAVGSTIETENFKDLIKDEYTGLDVTLVQLDRMMPVAGSVVRLTFTVQNAGDSTIAYVQGSSSNAIPEALTFEAIGSMLTADPDAPEGVAISTMDYQVKELAPGEAQSFTAFFDVVSGENTVVAFFEYAILDGTESNLIDIQPTGFATATWSITVE